MATKYLYGPKQVGFQVNRSVPVVVANVLAGVLASLTIAAVRSDASGEHVDLVAEAYDAVGTPKLSRALVGFSLQGPADGVAPDAFLARSDVFVGAAQIDGDGTAAQPVTIDLPILPDGLYTIQTVLEVTVPDA